MNAVRELIKKPVVLGAAGLLVGLFLGWFGIGWGLWPVTWSDAAPQHLRQDLKLDYLSMAVDSYSVNKNAALAQQRFSDLGENASQVLAQLETSQPQNTTNISAFRSAVSSGAALPQVTSAVEVTSTLGTEIPGAGSLFPTPQATKKQSALGALKNVFIILCVASSLVVIGLVIVFFMRSRGRSTRPSTPSGASQPTQNESAWPEYESTPAATAAEEPPMAQFMATYKLGDDLFDDSFSIDSPAGEFLGECGVGISENIGVGDPKKVTAFEVWLFDRNDIQTVTKVLMSEHAYNDDNIHQRLSTKGEPVLSETGVETVLETQTLQLVVRVVDMGYGDGATPSSFFDHMILELAVWPKA